MPRKHWVIVLIILISGYGIFTGVTDLNKSKNQSWTDESAVILIKKCIADSKERVEKYPDLTKDYCKCSTEKIQAEFTQAEYIKVTKMTIEKQKRKLLSVFQTCLTEYQENIEK